MALTREQVNFLFESGATVAQVDAMITQAGGLESEQTDQASGAEDFEAGSGQFTLSPEDSFTAPTQIISEENQQIIDNPTLAPAPTPTPTPTATVDEPVFDGGGGDVQPQSEDVAVQVYSNLIDAIASGEVENNNAAKTAYIKQFLPHMTDAQIFNALHDIINPELGSTPLTGTNATGQGGGEFTTFSDQANEFFGKVQVGTNIDGSPIYQSDLDKAAATPGTASADPTGTGFGIDGTFPFGPDGFFGPEGEIANDPLQPGGDFGPGDTAAEAAQRARFSNL